MRVVVWFQLFHLVRMTVRAVFALMLVLFRVACVGMLVFVDVVVFVSVIRPVVGVLMVMSMSVFVLMLVAMVVLAFHRIPSFISVRRGSSVDNSILAPSGNRYWSRASRATIPRYRMLP